MSNYKQKYFKYKAKYLHLKTGRTANQLGGVLEKEQLIKRKETLEGQLKALENYPEDIRMRHQSMLQKQIGRLDEQIRKLSSPTLDILPSLRQSVGPASISPLVGLPLSSRTGLLPTAGPSLQLSTFYKMGSKLDPTSPNLVPGNEINFSKTTETKKFINELDKPNIFTKEISKKTVELMNLFYDGNIVFEGKSDEQLYKEIQNLQNVPNVGDLLGIDKGLSTVSITGGLEEKKVFGKFNKPEMIWKPNVNNAISVFITQALGLDDIVPTTVVGLYTDSDGQKYVGSFQKWVDYPNSEIEQCEKGGKYAHSYERVWDSGMDPNDLALFVNIIRMEDTNVQNLMCDTKNKKFFIIDNDYNNNLPFNYLSVSMPCKFTKRGIDFLLNYDESEFIRKYKDIISRYYGAYPELQELLQPDPATVFWTTFVVEIFRQRMFLNLYNKHRTTGYTYENQNIIPFIEKVLEQSKILENGNIDDEIMKEYNKWFDDITCKGLPEEEEIKKKLRPKSNKEKLEEQLERVKKIYEKNPSVGLERQINILEKKLTELN
jgi:hypothetical protein